MILAVGCLKNLINPCRSWFSWSKTILDSSVFRNKSFNEYNLSSIRSPSEKKPEHTRKENLNPILGSWLLTGPSTCRQVPVWRQCLLLIDRLSRISSLSIDGCASLATMLATYRQTEPCFFCLSMAMLVWRQYLLPVDRLSHVSSLLCGGRRHIVFLSAFFS